jgi:UDP-N-acetylglucosamine 4,6-dehydratase (inverting)
MNQNFFKNKSLLITGGTGSFGSSYVKFLLQNKYPLSRIIIFSRDEFKQDLLQKELNSKKNPNLRFFLGDVRDKERLIYAFKDLDYVIHAAALKQVPAAEYNPMEFVKTNVFGAQNIVEAALYNDVKQVLALSTDKAVAPINLYGATKLCSDKIFIAANNIVGKKNSKFSVVRYGNVLGSRGSVLPEFLKAKLKKKFFEITDTRMTRFNILMKEAIELVDWSLKNCLGGEIIIPKLKSYKITDLAKAIESKSKLKITGIRPGEKIHEELITEADSYNCFEQKKCYLIVEDKNIKKFSEKLKIRKIQKVFSYTSDKNSFLSVKELEKIILKNFTKNYTFE